MTDSITLGDHLTVSPLGFGGMALTPVYGGAVDDEESLATLHHAVDVGVTFIDTANVYGSGDNERLIARLLADRRDDVTLATKFGIVANPAGSQGRVTVRGDAAYVRQCIDESLQRLQTDVVDLYYLHRRDPAVPIEETVGAMAESVSAGKVRHLGLSEVSADELRAAHAAHPIAAVQSEWSIWTRDIEGEVAPTAAELGVGLVPFSPLGRGFLTGSVRSAADISAADFRRTMPRFADGALEANRRVVDAIEEVAGVVGATAAQVALAWLRHRAEELGVISVPIPGTRRAARIDENLGSLWIELTADQVSSLGRAGDAVTGNRYADTAAVRSSSDEDTTNR
ncbi:aldo/keto reductase [Mycolicibacterium sp. 3033]|nr:aldo/keto reductase [Mycolicibacterium aurantiacum]